jgi:hypothetical protein
VRPPIATLAVECKILLLLLLDIVVLSPGAVLLIAYYPSYLYFTWQLGGGEYFKPVGFFVLVLAAGTIFARLRASSLDPTKDEPLMLALSSQPGVERAALNAASKVGRVAPSSLHVALSPVPWRAYGADLQRPRKAAVPIPIGCMDVWSV